MTATVLVDDRDLKVGFSAPWTPDDHKLFVKSKALPEVKVDYAWQTDSYTLTAPARFAHVLGHAAAVERGVQLARAGHLFDYQRWGVDLALKSRRFVLWLDCGLGKTPMQLDWIRAAVHETKAPGLIMAPLAVCHQTVDEVKKFYPGGDMELEFLQTRADVIKFCKGGGKRFGITNYEKMIDGVIPDMRWLGAYVGDESSILKSGGGVIKWNLIKSAKGIEYKLSCTATPAPNDTMEYASQASFLEKLRTEGEILWTFFCRDQKTQVWRVKPHAEDAFYRFMASWSIYMRKPGAYGFEDPFHDVPEPEIIDIRVPATAEQDRMALKYLRHYDPGSLIPQSRLGVMQRSKLSQLAKGFLYGEGRTSVDRVDSNKPAIVVDLVRKALGEGRQCLVWTVFDEESLILSEMLQGLPVEVLTGKDSEEARVEKLDRFRRGETAALISKAQLLGYGLNFQFCTRMVFSGFDDSFERFYQAVRRCYRYGSREQLKVYVPYVPGLEDHIWENVLRKRSQWEGDTARQEAMYARAMGDSVLSGLQK